MKLEVFALLKLKSAKQSDKGFPLQLYYLPEIIEIGTKLVWS